jgi:predicted MPP superfamily phosphohydrolase
MKTGKKCVVLSDIHFPFEDKVAIDLALSYIEKAKPDTVILNGDIMDCFTISKFDKDKAEGVTLKEEFKMTRDFLTKIETRVPNATLIFILGNHELRLRKYILRNAEALADLVSFEELLRASDRWQIVGKSMVENYVIWHDYYIGHFNRVSKFAAYTVKNIIADRGVNIIQAHVHRLGMYSQTYFDRTVYGYEMGCLCTLNPSYAVTPNWQQGFAVLERKGKVTQVKLVRIENGKLIGG